MRFSLNTDTIDTEELVPPLQPAVPVRHAPGDDPADVDGGVLLLAPHHIEPEPLLCLGQLHHPRVGVAFRGCKSCNGGLCCC